MQNICMLAHQCQLAHPQQILLHYNTAKTLVVAHIPIINYSSSQYNKPIAKKKQAQSRLYKTISRSCNHLVLAISLVGSSCNSLGVKVCLPCAAVPLSVISTRQCGGRSPLATYGQTTAAARVGRIGRGRVLGSLLQMTTAMTLKLILKNFRMVIARKTRIFFMRTKVDDLNRIDISVFLF
jgi:hypothetical protein